MKFETFTRRVRSWRAAFIGTSLILLFSGTTQNALAQNDRMVLLNVRVTDKLKQAVVNIPKEKFQITEDGVSQKIKLFATEQATVSYGLVIDNSGSMRAQLENVISAATKIVNSNSFEDQAFLVRFVSSDRMELMTQCTSDRKLLINGLQSMYVERGQSAVIDAVYLAADKLAKLSLSNDRPQRKALVIITDGEDRSSFYKQEQLFALLGATNIQVFVVGLTSELEIKSRNKAIALLNRLALDTGGRAFFPESPVDLEFIAEAIINDIRSQYIIGYVPSNNSSSNFHKLQISIADDPNNEHRITINRLGYSTTP